MVRYPAGAKTAPYRLPSTKDEGIIRRSVIQYHLLTIHNTHTPHSIPENKLIHFAVIAHRCMMWHDSIHCRSQYRVGWSEEAEKFLVKEEREQDFPHTISITHLLKWTCSSWVGDFLKWKKKKIEGEPPNEDQQLLLKQTKLRIFSSKKEMTNSKYKEHAVAQIEILSLHTLFANLSLSSSRSSIASSGFICQLLPQKIHSSKIGTKLDGLNENAFKSKIKE